MPHRAFEEVVLPHLDAAFNYARWLTKSDADAEDVTQTALLNAFRKLSQFRLDAQFRTWVTSIVINEAFMCLRAGRRFKHESLDQDDGKLRLAQSHGQGQPRQTTANDQNIRFHAAIVAYRVFLDKANTRHG